MADFALRTMDLGKQFRIGASRGRNPTLREAISQAARRPIERLLHPGTATSHKTELLWALRHLDLEVEQGDIVGIIGRNGAGKSTLLKVLSHIMEPTEGRVEIRGRVGTLLEIGTGFHPELSGRENIFLNGTILGMSRAEIRSKFDEIVDFSEVSRFLDTPVKRYSSGMYIRLAFAVAAHLNPDILFVDEVLAVGDVAFQRKCLGKMEDVAGEGRTVLFVSHNMQAVRTLCNRVVELEYGRLINEGDTTEVIEAYLHRLAQQSASLTWKKGEGPANAVVELRGLHLLAPSGQPRSVVSTASPTTIRLEFVVLRNTPNLMIGFELINGEGAVVLSSLHTDMEPEQWPQLSQGYNALECQIPAGLLNAGQYFVRPRWATYGHKGRTCRPDVMISFEAHRDHGDSPYTHVARPGVVSPILEWTAAEGELQE